MTVTPKIAGDVSLLYLRNSIDAMDNNLFATTGKALGKNAEPDTKKAGTYARTEDVNPS